MLKSTPFMIAAALVLSGPALSQGTNDTAAAGTNSAVGDPAAGGGAGNAVGTGTTNDMAATADPTMNGLTAGSAPATAAPGTIDTSYGEPGGGEAEDDDSFPWGLIGLLGLAGLIPRKRRTDTARRTDR